MKTQMKTTRDLDPISKQRVVFICLLIGHQDLEIKTKQIEHKNNTSVNTSMNHNHPYCQFIGEKIPTFLLFLLRYTTKLLNFDWSRAVQLIPNCTP